MIMSGMIAMEAELNGMVKEYLEYYGFEATLAKFSQECVQKGKPTASLDKSSSSGSKSNKISTDLVNLYNQGKRKEFFRLWSEHIQEERVNENLNAQKLELELNIHFAIFPFKEANLNEAMQKESMSAFKNYIDNKGRVLCQTKEFLPYFGLPYHQNPHEGFPELFAEKWTSELARRLDKFLKEALKQNESIRLIDLYNKTSNSESSQANANNLKHQLIESEKRTMAFMRKFNKVQSDYHGLIGITAELVDSLENTISGKPVTSEYISNICFRLFNTQLKQSVDLIRPGTAGELVRSLAFPKLSSHNPGMAINEKQSEPFKMPQLDYSKLKQDILNQPERKQLLLLQAIRWSLTKSETIEQRQKILTTYIASDLLDCRSEKRGQQSVIGLLKSSSETIRQSMARLINTFASLNHGRSYLGSNFDLVKMIHYVLKIEHDDNFTRKNLLGALQKLSLRHRLQMIMVNDGIIDTLIDLLEKNESLSDYSLEYAIALLMNLTLKEKGKTKCASEHKRSLKVVSELLGNSNPEIQSYVNAVLYNILSVQAVRTQAKAMNLEEILRGYISDGQVEINQQRELIIKKINSNDEQTNAEHSDDHEDEEEEEEDDDEEEDAEIMELELDGGEQAIGSREELCGDALLIKDYSINSKTTHNNNNNNSNELLKSRVRLDDNVSQRPITPLNVRQSQSVAKPASPIVKRAGDSSSANILVIESNDLNAIADPFVNRQKLPRTPGPRQVSTGSSNSSSSSSVVGPKLHYSVMEPRPSSVQSNKSKSSYSSSTNNANNNNNNNTLAQTETSLYYKSNSASSTSASKKK